MTSTFFAIAFLFFVFFSVLIVSDEDKKAKINLDDILVGDTVRIKGEEFTVVGYSENGVMEITDGVENYYIQVSEKDIKFVLHYSGSIRKFIEIQGTKSTVKGDYLSKIKFN